MLCHRNVSCDVVAGWWALSRLVHLEIHELEGTARILHEPAGAAGGEVGQVSLEMGPQLPVNVVEQGDAGELDGLRHSSLPPGAGTPVVDRTTGRTPAARRGSRRSGHARALHHCEPGLRACRQVGRPLPQCSFVNQRLGYAGLTSLIDGPRLESQQLADLGPRDVHRERFRSLHPYRVPPYSLVSGEPTALRIPLRGSVAAPILRATGSPGVGASRYSAEPFEEE